MLAPCLLLTLLPAAKSTAAITFQAPVTISSDSDVSTTGTLVQALSFASPATVNGIFFSGPNVGTASGSLYTNGNFSFLSGTNLNNSSFGAGTGSPWNSLTPDYRNVLAGAIYSGLQQSMIVDLNGLSLGQAYEVQLWVHDNRGGSVALRNQEVIDANTVPMDFNSTNTAGGVGQYVIGTFTAFAATESFQVRGFGIPQVNAIQLRAIPEPGTALLGVFPLGVLALRRRRRTPL
jgi:hypothetical protein